MPLIIRALDSLPPPASLSRGLPSPEAELAACAGRRSAAREALQPLPRAAVRAAVSAWMTAACGDVSRTCGALLAAGCPTLSACSQMQATLAASLASAAPASGCSLRAMRAQEAPAAQGGAVGGGVLAGVW